MKAMLNKFTIELAKISTWATTHGLNIILFNLLITLLFLLRSAGYFQPYYLISVNAIVLSGLLASIVVFRAKSKAMFLVATLFWIFAYLVKAFGIDVWAERTTVYAYEALVLGTIMLCVEGVRKS